MNLWADGQILQGGPRFAQEPRAERSVDIARTAGAVDAENHAVSLVRQRSRAGRGLLHLHLSGLANRPHQRAAERIAERPGWIGEDRRVRSLRTALRGDERRTARP